MNLRAFLKLRYLALGVLLLFVTVFFTLRPTFHRLAIGLLEKEIRKAGIVADLHEPHLSFIGLSAKKALIKPLRSFVQIPFEDVDMRVDLREVINLQVKSTLLSRLYGGNLSFIAYPSATAMRGRATLKDIDLALNPQLAGFGITSGKLNADIPQFLSRPGNDEFDFSLRIGELNKPHPTTLAPRLTGLPLTISLPGFKDGTIQTQGNVKEKKVVLQSFSFLSSLGTITLSGALPQQRSGQITLQGQVSLTDEGLEKVGSYIPLLTLGRLKKTDRDFTFSIRGNMYQPKTTFSRISSGASQEL